MGLKLSAVIFDFNGVIIDDEPLHLELFRRVLAEVGLTLNEEEYQEKYLGFDDRGCFTAVLAESGRPADSKNEQFIDQLISRKARYYLEEIDRRYLLFPGGPELIRRLALKYPLAIASGALRNEIEVVLRRGSIREFFRVIVASEDVGACKPDPEGYLKALSALNDSEPHTIEPGNCLVIEDSIAGIEAARRAGMRCLAVTNSYPAGLLGAADWIVPTLVGCDPEAFWGNGE